MKNLFQTSFIILLAILLLFSSVSCNKEKDAVSPDVANTEFNNVKYTIKNGFIQNGGAVDFFLDDEAEEKTHFTYNFILTDGTPTFENGHVVSLNNGKIVISAVLVSPGTNGFQTGVFEYDNWLDNLDLEDEELEERFSNKFFFPMALVFTDSDGDKNWQEEMGSIVSGGTITVTGTAPNYTTTYDLTLPGNKTLKGSFAGKFRIVQD